MIASLLIVTTLAVGQVAPGPAPSDGGIARFGAPLAPAPGMPENPPPVTGPSAPRPLPVGGAWTPPQYSSSPTGSSSSPGPGAGADSNSKCDADKNGKKDADKKEKDGDKNGKKDADKKEKKEKEPPRPGFCYNFVKGYMDVFCPKKNGNGDEEETPPAPAERRALPEPWSSPPFPGHEYQGYPLIGVPPAPLDSYPLMKGLLATPWIGDWLQDNRIKIYGWATVGGNWSTAKESNSPAAYWLVPNHLELDQAVLRFEREADTVQTDHMDYGFRLTGLYGIDYRYTTAGGWLSDQLLVHNRLYGFDPIECYFDWYIPWVAEGMVVRVGRWVACPDIETQLAPDNYLASHSILFTYDTYTQTGVMLTFKLTDQWMVQAAINCGDDMAPWYQGAKPCGFAAVRWVSKDNNDAFYTAMNQVDSAQFQHFQYDGQPAGHDNYNYIVTTWEHRFTEEIHTKTEAYFMWEYNAELGGTPSLGPVQSFGGGGGNGTLIPGLSRAYGVLNYTMFAISKQDYITFRNEWWRDETGFRAGFPGDYTSHTIGLSHNFNELLQIRPEIGYYRDWTEPAFDLGTKKGIWIYGFDMTMRF